MNCQDAQMCAFVFKFERQMEMEDGYPGLTGTMASALTWVVSV